MHTELLKTFLEVEKAGHFGHAAENLYLTPAAVSARIRQLEGILGQPLFNRNRKHVSLTPAGERLKPYAQEILDTWNRALHESPLAGDFPGRLSVGSTPNLWDCLLHDYLTALHLAYPDLQLRASCHDSNFLTSQLQNRQLDMTVQLEPLNLDGIAREKVGELTLVMVSTERELDLADLHRVPYVQVDWSARFAVEHQRLIGKADRRPVLYASTGRIGLNFLLANGGTMYLPDFQARGLLEKQRLFPVDEAESVVQPFYVTYLEDSSKRSLIPELNRLLAGIPGAPA